MNQSSFATGADSGPRPRNPRAELLDFMDSLVPWGKLVAGIEPFYPERYRGRPPAGIETMLRMYLLQRWFSFPDEEVEAEIFDSEACRIFMKIDFDTGQLPAAAVLRRFRRMLEKTKTGKVFFDEISGIFAEKAALMGVKRLINPVLVRIPGR